MKRLIVLLALAAGLGGCLTPSAYSQSRELIGQPLDQAVARYGAPDQPVTGGAGAYSWSRGRLAGACTLKVRTGADGRITNASVVAVGFRTCRGLLEDSPRR